MGEAGEEGQQRGIKLSPNPAMEIGDSAGNLGRSLGSL